jgi:hypothetical protein
LKRGETAAIEMAKKYLQNPMAASNAMIPMAAKPRVVRDALIQAVDRGEGTYLTIRKRARKPP